MLLNGEQFAKKARMGNVDLFHTEASVSAEQLAQAMLAAAILANEQAGAIRLDVREKKALLGFRKVSRLYEDSPNPWQSAIDLVKAGLASRYLLDAVEEKRLKVFTTTRYELPDGTAALIAQQPLEPVKQLLQSCHDNQPERWKLLQNEIGSAIKARTEQDGGPDVDF